MKSKLAKKALIVICFAGVAAIVLLVAVNLAPAAKETRKNQSPVSINQPSKEERLRFYSSGQEDPMGTKPILGYVLNYPFLRHALAVEISLNETQEFEIERIVREEEDQLRKLIHSGLTARDFNTQVYSTLAYTGEKLKKLLNPMQYARFRDWVIEGWSLEFWQSSVISDGVYVPGKGWQQGVLHEARPDARYLMTFLESQLTLSQNEAQAIHEITREHRKEILPARMRLLEIRLEKTSFETAEKKGNNVSNQVIAHVASELEAALLKVLPPKKRNMYLQLKSVSLESGSRNN